MAKQNFWGREPIPDDVKVGFENAMQAALWNAELRGQISDGYWENAGPREHWRRPSSHLGVVRLNKLGPDMQFARSYNLAAKDLLDVVGDRMLFAAKTAHLHPNLAQKEKHSEVDWHGIESVANAYLEDGYKPQLRATAHVPDYVKEKVSKISGLLGAKDEEDLKKELVKIANVSYTMGDMVRDLRRMNKIIKGEIKGKDDVKESTTFKQYLGALNENLSMQDMIDTLIDDVIDDNPKSMPDLEEVVKNKRYIPADMKNAVVKAVAKELGIK